jgi:hypothetical protein
MIKFLKTLTCMVVASPQTGTDGDDVFTTSPTEIEAGGFDGRLGSDTLQLTEGGSFDLRKPLVFASIETVLGSEFDDTIAIDAERLAGILTIDGGASPALTWDVLELHGTALDLRAKTMVNIDQIHIRTDSAVLTLDSKAVALLATGYEA